MIPQVQDWNYFANAQGLPSLAFGILPSFVIEFRSVSAHPLEGKIFVIEVMHMQQPGIIWPCIFYSQNLWQFQAHMVFKNHPSGVGIHPHVLWKWSVNICLTVPKRSPHFLNVYSFALSAFCQKYAQGYLAVYFQ
jgi:hypothetical protein